MIELATDPIANVNTARGWAQELLTREQNHARYREAAIDNLASRLRIARGAIWALLYRPPKDIPTHVYSRLGEAYLNECDRQERKYIADSQDFHASTSLGAAVARAGAAVAGRDFRVVK